MLIGLMEVIGFFYYWTWFIWPFVFVFSFSAGLAKIIKDDENSRPLLDISIAGISLLIILSGIISPLFNL